MVWLRVTAAFFSVVWFATQGRAEDLTNEQLLALFQDQREAFLAAQQSELGKTRGLTLVTVEDIQPTTLAPSMTALDPLAPEMATPATDIFALSLPATEGGAIVFSEAGSLVPPATDQPATADTPSLVQALADPMPNPEPLNTATPAQQQPAVFGALAPELQVNLNIKFGFDSALLQPDQIPLLAQMCTVMKSSDINLFRIVGHTDAIGSDDYNQILSQLRAEEVQRYLVNDCGIEARRLEAVGLGEQFLSNQKDPKAAANRRVEFQALS